MKQRPPYCALFPYTTLFRSALLGDGYRVRPADAQGVGRQRRHDLRVEGRARRCLQRTAESGRQAAGADVRSEEHTSELQSLAYLVCRLLLEKKNQNYFTYDC